MSEQQHISIFVMHDDDPTDFNWVQAWIERWKLVDKLCIADYSTGGWEHYWDIEACADAVAEVPAEYLCASEWATPESFKK